MTEQQRKRIEEANKKKNNTPTVNNGSGITKLSDKTPAQNVTTLKKTEPIPSLKKQDNKQVESTSYDYYNAEKPKGWKTSEERKAEASKSAYATRLGNELNNTVAEDNKKREENRFYNNAQKELNQITEGSDIQKWLDPSYKMSKEEKKQAKQLIKDYKQGLEAERGTSNNKASVDYYNFDNDADKAKYQYINQLANKISPLASFGYGMIDAIPFLNVDKLQQKHEDNTGIKTNYTGNTFEDEMKNAQTQNTLANVAGNFATSAMQYGAANELLSGVGAFDKAGQALSKIPGLSKGGETIASLLRGQAADTVLDTLPMAIQDVKDNKSVEEIAKDVGANQIKNLKFNIGSEAVGQILPRLFKGKAKNVDEVVDAVKNNDARTVDDVVNNAPNTKPVQDVVDNVKPIETPQPQNVVPPVDNLENAAKTAENVVEGTKQNSSYEDLLKQADEYEKEGNYAMSNVLREQAQNMKSANEQAIVEQYIKDNNVDVEQMTPDDYISILNGDNPDLPKFNAQADSSPIINDMANTSNDVVKPLGSPENSLPKLNNNGDNPSSAISQHYETLKKSDTFKSADAQLKLEEAKKNGAFSKDVENRRASMDQAMREFSADPQKVANDVINNEWQSGHDVDKSALAISDALDNGNVTDLNRLLRNQAEKLTKAGRELRAVQDNYLGTKEDTMLRAASLLNDKAEKVLKGNKKVLKQLDSLTDEIMNGNVDNAIKALNLNDSATTSIQNAINAGASADEVKRMLATYKATGVTEISEEVLSKVNSLYDKIAEGNYGVNSKERAKVENQIYATLASELGGNRTFKEQWDSWRYLAMLGNPKTHLRNVLGNSMQYMVSEIKDNVAAGLEGLTDATAKAIRNGEGIDRTKSVLNRLSKEDNALIKLARSDADEMYKVLNDGNKFNDVKDAIRQNRKAFNNEGLNTVNDINSTALDAEDYFGLKNKYSKSLARYLKANGADTSIFKNTDEASEKLLAKAREHAIKEAKQATFHEDSAFADLLSNVSSKLRSSDNIGSKAAGVAMEGIIPFKKTPINILKQGIKYSPASLAKTLYDFTDMIKTGNKSASDAIEDLASGLTGTGVLALGSYLASKGLLSGKANEDYSIDTIESEQGKQNYAINIDGKSYTLDWLAPVSMPLFVGAELYNSLSEGVENSEEAFDKVMACVSAIAEPMTEMSMLQGINDALKQLSNGVDSAFATLGTNTLIGYATQGVPTMAGQVARAIDPIRRDTYSEKTNGFLKQVDRAITKSENKIPGLSSENPEYYNTKGETQQNVNIPSLGGRLAYQMLSPGYYADNSNVTETDNELNRLYEATGKNVYGNVTSGSVDGAKLSKGKKAEYQKLYGQTNTQLAESLVNSEAYKNMNDDEKAEAVIDARKFAKALADFEVGGKSISSTMQKEYEAYQRNGIDGVIKYYEDKAKAKSLDLSTSEMQKAQSYNGGVDKYVEDKATADSLGMSLNTYTDKNRNYEGGAEQYATDKQNASDLGLGLDTYLKKEQDYEGGAEQYAKDKQAADVAGYSIDNLKKVQDHYGDDQSKIAQFNKLNQQYKQYTASQNDGEASQIFGASPLKLTSFLSQSNISPEEAGDIITLAKGGSDKLGEKAKSFYDAYGNSGVYSYYQTISLADTDGNGSLKKEDELIPFLARQNMSASDKNAMVQMFYPKNKKRYF